MNISSYTNTLFVEQLMRQYQPGKDIRVVSVEPLPLDNSASILAVLTAGRSDKIIGHFGLLVTFESGGKEQSRRMVMKIKPNGREICEMLQALANGCGSPLSEVYQDYKWLTGFSNTHMRELEIYGKLSSGLYPDIFGVHADHSGDIFVILMEYLEDVDLLNSVMSPHEWSDKYIKQALLQLASWHAMHLEKELPLDQSYWADRPSREYMIKMTPLWKSLLANAAQQFPELYSPSRVQCMRKIINDIPVYWQELDSMPKTLIHNDLNPRNTCFKRAGEDISFCVYDWELATYHVPQYDVVEFLCFVLDETRYDLRKDYLDFYRQILNEQTGMYADIRQFNRGFELAAFDFGLHRLGMYMMAHTVSPYPFLPRVVNSYFDTLSQVQNWD